MTPFDIFWFLFNHHLTHAILPAPLTLKYCYFNVDFMGNAFLHCIPLHHLLP